ncbi:Orn/Lys/Arg decarboxylase N-terminal domain-containing protein, partial [Acinetobacter baumannii]
SDSSIQCVILDWDLVGDVDHQGETALLGDIRRRNAALPVFLLTTRSAASEIPAEVMQQADDFIWLLEDTASFIGGRIVAAMQR